MLLLKDELGLPADDSEGIEDLWEAFIELDVHDGTNDGDNLALVSLNSGGHRELALYKEEFQWPHGTQPKYTKSF